MELRNLIVGDKRDHSLLAIEEPEAHLHPHLQRLQFTEACSRMREQVYEDGEDPPLSIISVTTHSPHIASVAPVKSIVLLRERDGGERQSVVPRFRWICRPRRHLTLQRYPDFTRAEILCLRSRCHPRRRRCETLLVPRFAEELQPI